VNRRDVLGALGLGSAHALWWAFGCSGPARSVRGEQIASGGEVRTWLHDAVGRLAAAGFAAPRALAVTSRRTTAAIDILGARVQRGRSDGVVLVVRDKDGARREQVTTDLSASGVAAAVRALAGNARPGKIELSRPEVWNLGGGDEPSDAELIDQVDKLRQLDTAISSRVVYRAEVIDIDDANVWSIAAGHDREQRLVRVRQAVTRVAWNGTQPVIGEASHGWLGAIGAQALGKADIEGATHAALALTTPATFDDGIYAVVLDPSIVAQLIDAAVAAMLTTKAARRPEVAHRLAVGANVASPLITLVDDPTDAAKYGAYGSYRFDDQGEPGAPIALVEHGHVSGKLDDRRRSGHTGMLEPTASHLRLEPGTDERDALGGDGFVLEGGAGAVVDPASDRVIVAAARARELRGGQETGRTFADVELVGELGPLLAAVAGVSKQTRMFTMRDERDGRPRWRSIAAPWLRTKGRLRARRGPA
jgi:predicted Zn-dependent protease